MGSAGLIEIKRRIKSVESTRKITKAMNLVATSKLRKARKELVANERYFDVCQQIIDELMAVIPDDFESQFFNNEVKTSDKLYIVIASDTGLCGGFNGNIASSLNTMIENKGTAKVVVAGAKGISYMKKYGFTTVGEYIEIPDIPTVKEVKSIYQDALYRFKKGEVCEVNVVFTEFISPIKQEVKIERLFPIDKSNTPKSDMLIEPNVSEVLNSSLDVYFKSKLRRAILHSKVSEQNARMTAMDGATRNANDILKDLNIKFNRIRQSMITQEISEIVGGAEAQK
ncbi:ATP synthase F1 subunit gamma [Clostridium sp.]|uniref:ATP synthase F1 subunit gamma n=1 Tax=Clostridium sp. TaxID=1506 RepID=UPI003F2F2FC9